MIDKDKEKIKWKMKHSNCENCIWYKTRCFDFIGHSSKNCELKEEWISFPKLKARFCKQYYVEGEDEIDE